MRLHKANRRNRARGIELRPERSIDVSRFRGVDVLRSRRSGFSRYRRIDVGCYEPNICNHVGRGGI